MNEFYCRVTLRENLDLLTSIQHAKCVMGIVSETSGEIRDQLPRDYDSLFELSHS